jgi:hypothetical protein
MREGVWSTAKPNSLPSGAGKSLNLMQPDPTGCTLVIRWINFPETLDSFQTDEGSFPKKNKRKKNMMTFQRQITNWAKLG